MPPLTWTPCEMINPSSHSMAEFDQRLLSVEELFRRRHPRRASEELAQLPAESYATPGLARGLYLALRCESSLLEGSYQQAIESGLAALVELAPTSMNRRVGRVLWNLSKCYSLIGELREAEMRARDSISAYRRVEYRPGVVLGLNELAKVASIRSEYAKASEFLQDALILSEGDSAREHLLRSNLGRLHIYTGRWDEAEKLLLSALEHDQKSRLDLPASRKLLSLGYLSCLRRDFTTSEERYSLANELIEKNDFGRERLNLAEYRGLLALERGDYRQALSILKKTLVDSKKLAPESALVTQVGRLLTEALMGLELYDDAFEMAQKTLARCERLGERVECAITNTLLGQLYVNRTSAGTDSEKLAVSHYEAGVEKLREIGDPYMLAHALMRSRFVYGKIGSEESERIHGCLKEAVELFGKLGVADYVAEAELAFATVCFREGRFNEGYTPLRHAREMYQQLGDSAKLRKIEGDLKSFATEAVAHSVSRANPFNLFGGFASEADYKSFHSADIYKTIEMLRDRTGADRAVIISTDSGSSEVYSSPGMTENERRGFVATIKKLLGEEFSTERPTIVFDSSIDPYINELAPSSAKSIVASVIVAPLRVAGETVGSIYLDRLSDGNRHSAMRPFSQDDLDLAVGFSDFVALELAQAQKAQLIEDNKRLKEQMQKKVDFPSIMTRNSGMLELLSSVRQVVNSDISITITGETGTGKDLLAKAIHYNSNRSDKRFISVNCAALPETLLESELFGYQRGAFTGADRDKPGLFEEADGGAFFLDEIGDMPLAVQAKILRVLEEKEVVRLGESLPRKVDVRIISATHKDLHEAMEAGVFRRDLYYRLSALCFHLPSLRERREDIPLLVEHFSGESGVTFSSDAMAALVNYNWPGNIRELENEVKKLCLVAGESKRISSKLLSPKITGGTQQIQPAVITQEGATVATPPAWIEQQSEFSLYDFIAMHEKRFITEALEQSQGVKKHAAAKLNIPESTLRLKIKQYDINLDQLGQVH